MPKKQANASYETLRIQLELMRRIPRDRLVTTQELCKQIKAAGYDRDIRSIQRMLKSLSEADFGIECDERGNQYGYKWKQKSSGFVAPSLTHQESLTLMLVEQQLKSLLPPVVMQSMAGFFDQAKHNLSDMTDEHAKLNRQWLKKIRVVSEMQPLLPPSIAEGVLDVISQALYMNHKLSVVYVNNQRVEKEHLIKPLGLAQQGTRMYLVCQFEGHENFRILALHRIKHVSSTLEPFKRPGDFDLEQYDGEGHFAVGRGKKIKLSFCIAKGPGKHILESPLSKDQTHQEFDDHYKITATVMETLLLDRWLKSFGDGVWGVEVGGV
jgi:predicted DNA-binding transcriptional regulator YafY